MLIVPAPGGIACSGDLPNRRRPPEEPRDFPPDEPRASFSYCVGVQEPCQIETLPASSTASTL